MYIARFGAGYHVKRMPNSGERHAVSCTSFDPPPSMSGIGPLLGSAICVNNDEGFTTLKLGFAMSKLRAATKAQRDVCEPAPSVRARSPRMSLRAMLHYFLDLGGLNRWSPAEPKRHWEAVREKLLVAAVGNFVAGRPLLEHMYLPESFSLADKAGIVQRRQCHFAQLAASRSAAVPLMLLIGEVKGFSTGRGGMQMVVKHMADSPLELPGDLFRRLQRRFETEIMLWNEIDGSRLLLAATVSVGSAGVAGIVDLILMVTDRHWLGLDSVAEKALIDKLIYEERCFVKPLRYGVSNENQLATAVLLDTGDPVPLYIVAPVDGVIARPRLRSALGTVWSWSIADGIPSLPSAENVSLPRGGRNFGP